MSVEPSPDARDLFTRDEFVAAWRLMAGTTLSEAEIADHVDEFLGDRGWVMVGDLVGALASPSASALERARQVWGPEADAFAERVRGILRSLREELGSDAPEPGSRGSVQDPRGDAD